MISITVQRGLGNKQGPDITDSLLTTEAVARARGLFEIDYNFSNRSMVPTTGPYIGYVVPGSLEQITEEEGNYRGVVHSCAITISLGEDRRFLANTNLQIEKES